MAEAARNDTAAALAVAFRELAGEMRRSASDVPPEPEMMTVEEAAAFLRVDAKTICEAIKNGEAPWAKRLGPRVIRINRSALLKWFESDTEIVSQRSGRREHLSRRKA